LLVSPTEDQGKILSAFAHIAIGGRSDLATALQIAQLALKHRKNKNGGQRILSFVGGPVSDTKEALTKIGKLLKKNNVAIDIISFGEIEENNEKLSALVEATCSNDNSHLLTVPCGISPINAILSSPIMSMGGGGMSAAMGASGSSMAGGAAAAGGENFDMYGGIDPSMDPELAMAIRVSTEEARAKEEARVKAAQDQSASEQPSASSSSSSSSSSAVVAPFGGYGASDEEDEEALMQRALEMSMAEMMHDQAAEGAKAAASSSSVTADSDFDVDEELRQALAMSVNAEKGISSSSAAAPASSSSSSSSFIDPAFVSQLLGSVDQNDPLFQAALAQLQAGSQPKNNEEEKKKEEDVGERGKKRKGDDK